MNRPILKVLVVDDDEDDFLITKEIFEEIPARNIKLDWAPTYQKGLESYFNAAHDVYFVDYILGAKNGIDFLMEGKKARIKNPVIMITGKGDQRVDKLAMEHGAADYLVKGELDAEKLERAVRYALDRFKASKQLADSEAKYRSVFENSKDMLFITDNTGQFLDSNNSCLKILNYTREELLGMKIQDLMESIEDKALYETLVSTLTEIADDERILISKSGKKKSCLISTIVQHDSEGVTTIQGVIHDITKRRKAETDLATAEKLAVTGRVVRMIGHEIRNPLTNINLSLEQIESEIKNHEGIDVLLDIIRRNSDRINSLITELLNSSKPAQLQIAKVSINKIIENSIKLIQDRLVLKKVTLETNLDINVCDINVDETKIQIALLNILVNAVEAVKEETGIIKISTWSEEEMCVVEICDNGIGIAPESLGRIFDPFFSGKPKGTGLGLSTTHNIVVSHNGSIDVSSFVDKGTCFILKFSFN